MKKFSLFLFFSQDLSHTHTRTQIIFFKSTRGSCGGVCHLMKYSCGVSRVCQCVCTSAVCCYDEGRGCEEGGGEGREGETGGGMQVAASPVFPGNKSSKRQESTALRSFNAASAPVSSSAASLQEEEEEQEEWRDSGGGQGVGEALQYCRKRLRGERRVVGRQQRRRRTKRRTDGRKEVKLTKRKTGERGRTERETEEEEQKGGGSGERRWRRTDGEVRLPAGGSAGRFQCEKFLTAADAEVVDMRTAGRAPMDLLPGGLGLRDVR